MDTWSSSAVAFLLSNAHSLPQKLTVQCYGLDLTYVTAEVEAWKENAPTQMRRYRKRFPSSATKHPW